MYFNEIVVLATSFLSIKNFERHRGSMYTLPMIHYNIASHIFSFKKTNVCFKNTNTPRQLPSPVGFYKKAYSTAALYAFHYGSNTLKQGGNADAAAAAGGDQTAAGDKGTVLLSPETRRHGDKGTVLLSHVPLSHHTVLFLRYKTKPSTHVTIIQINASVSTQNHTQTP